MLGACDVIAFVATRDGERARHFYQTQLGLELVADEPFALVFNAHGVMLRIARVTELAPARHTVLGWKVPDVREAVEALQQKGIALERYPGMPQDERGICQFPGGARVAWFKDPDGNTLSLAEFASSPHA
jgi:catechol 2,3-dioxygenase-like lactoylglutathione lyase family enzyme